MKSLIETLESRQLLTGALSLVQQDSSVFHANMQSVQADLASYSQTANEAIAKLAADTHKGKGTGPRGNLLKTLSSDEISGLHKVHNAVVSLLSATIQDTNAIIADLKQILKKSTPALQSKLTADIGKLKSGTSTLESNVTTAVTNVQTMITNDVTALAGLSALNTDATKAKSTFTNGLNTVMTDLTSLSGTITKIATDAAS